MHQVQVHGRLAQRERNCLTSSGSGVQIPHRPPEFSRAVGLFARWPVLCKKTVKPFCLFFAKWGILAKAFHEGPTRTSRKMRALLIGGEAEPLAFFSPFCRRFRVPAVFDVQALTRRLPMPSPVRSIHFCRACSKGGRSSKRFSSSLRFS